MGTPLPHCSGILVIDDDDAVRHALLDALRDEGYPVREASNGSEALLQLQATTGRGDQLPCVILLDLMMPVMDGSQFREEMLRDPRLTDIPVVVISADNNARDKASTMKVAGRLAKPLRLDRLLSTVAQYC